MAEEAPSRGEISGEQHLSVHGNSTDDKCVQRGTTRAVDGTNPACKGRVFGSNKQV